ncbi:uncharacterized protein Z518_03195 [Rhinocladiella mackenziei CBS 650.93]|uniref:RING-type domain-containing protein n=1 Tax=Rhinocladiella mackenziei CBS 650.93 TaxID=1442369 RepID=A0A0D2IRG1_9EURO|nr:uncharacterized protein Z518_03195 [Rhinocladiella mackenziei CBS 650.93]KIX08539.1 hypothetical protein Z518_03195 [Rhinocladiella mackenziei CBS 650.93]
MSSSASVADSLSLSSDTNFDQPLPRLRQRSAQPPRLRSPRLFRDFFHAMSDGASRRQATLPHANYQDTVQDVNRALQSANRALQNAQEAFHQARRTRSDPEPANQLVDLTNSPPDSSAEIHFISRTTHPHDSTHNLRSRRLNTLDEPVYPSRPNIPAIDAADPISFVGFWPVHRRPGGPRLPPILPVQNPLESMAEEEAILRQRENHSNWERTQARNRQRIPDPPSTMSPPSASSSTTAQSRRSASPPKEDPAIESVDLTAVDDSASLSATLAKQREEAILAQRPGTDAGRTSLTAYKCPVCMDTPTDATSTTCGHVFCHRCIVDTLNWSIEQRREDAPRNHKVKGVCPVCRKQLDLKDGPGNGRSLVPLELKLMVKKRKREDKGKQKMLKVETASDDDDENDRFGRGKENIRAGKARKRESTEEALWGEFMAD